MQDIFEALLEKAHTSTSAVSKGTGIPYSTLNEWRKGKTKKISPENLQKIAEFFGVAPWIFYDSADNVGSYLDGKSPVYDVAAGPGRTNTGYTDDYIKSDDDCLFAKVHGDSMLPELRDGDIVRVEETADVSPRDFAVVRIDGEDLTIKHVEWTNDGLWIRAENKEVFADRFYTVKEISLLPVQVVGKAVEVRRML